MTVEEAKNSIDSSLTFLKREKLDPFYDYYNIPYPDNNIILSIKEPKKIFELCL